MSAVDNIVIPAVVESRVSVAFMGHEVLILLKASVCSMCLRDYGSCLPAACIAFERILRRFNVILIWMRLWISLWDDLATIVHVPKFLLVENAFVVHWEIVHLVIPIIVLASHFHLHMKVAWWLVGRLVFLVLSVFRLRDLRIDPVIVAFLLNLVLNLVEAVRWDACMSLHVASLYSLIDSRRTYWRLVLRNDHGTAFLIDLPRVRRYSHMLSLDCLLMITEPCVRIRIWLVVNSPAELLLTLALRHLLKFCMIGLVLISAYNFLREDVLLAKLLQCLQSTMWIHQVLIWLVTSHSGGCQLLAIWVEGLLCECEVVILWWHCLGVEFDLLCQLFLADGPGIVLFRWMLSWSITSLTLTVTMMNKITCLNVFRDLGHWKCWPGWNCSYSAV